MTDITNADDIIDVRDIIARVEELREQRTERWAAGWNMPGYMPDSDPAEFGTACEAREYVATELKALADDQGDEELLELSVAVHDGEGELGVTINGLHYFVTLDGTMGLDDEEADELETFESILEDLAGNGGDEQWEGVWYPVTLIRDSHFAEYAEDMVKDIGDLPRDIPSYLEIDWEATARNIRMDYTSTEFEGVTYWYR